jgi:predicted dehydrogenase
LGRVSAASGFWGTTGAVDAWQTSFPPDASPETIDFKAFLAQAPPRDFDLKRFFRWPAYWDYGGGLAASRFVPLLADLQSLLGLRTPSRVVAGGRLHRWKDGRETPDVLTAVLDYATGPTVTLSASLNGAGMPRSIQVFGSDATLVLEDQHLIVRPDAGTEQYGEMANTLPKEYRDWFYMMHGMSNQGQIRSGVNLAEPALEYTVPQGAPSVIAGQLNDFITAVRTRVSPAGSAQLPADAADAAQLINAAYREQQPLPDSAKIARERQP